MGLLEVIIICITILLTVLVSVSNICDSFTYYVDRKYRHFEHPTTTQEEVDELEQRRKSSVTEHVPTFDDILSSVNKALEGEDE